MKKCPECGSGLRSDQDGYAKCVNPKCGWTEWGATHRRSKKMSKLLEKINEIFAIADNDEPIENDGSEGSFQRIKRLASDALAALATTEEESKRLKTIEKYLIEHKKAIEEDERYHYKTATVFENAPLALIQFGMKAETALINQALNAKKEEVCKTCGGSEEVAISVDFSHHHNVPDYKTCPDCKNEKVKNETM